MNRIKSKLINELHCKKSINIFAKNIEPKRHINKLKRIYSKTRIFQKFPMSKAKFKNQNKNKIIFQLNKLDFSKIAKKKKQLSNQVHKNYNKKKDKECANKCENINKYNSDNINKNFNENVNKYNNKSCNKINDEKIGENFCKFNNKNDSENFNKYYFENFSGNYNENCKNGNFKVNLINPNNDNDDFEKKLFGNENHTECKSIIMKEREIFKKSCIEEKYINKIFQHEADLNSIPLVVFNKSEKNKKFSDVEDQEESVKSFKFYMIHNNISNIKMKKNFRIKNNIFFLK